MRSGVVTFLDVLGWKGVYAQKQDAIHSLTLLIEGVRKQAERKPRGRTMNTIEVKSISDTIGIFTHASCTNSEISAIIDIHDEICQWLIPQSIESEIPVRDAIFIGELQIFDQIFVSKAIDEAASWHEQSRRLCDFKEVKFDLALTDSDFYHQVFDTGFTGKNCRICRGF